MKKIASSLLVLDLTKAFDCINHSVLFKKIRKVRNSWYTTKAVSESATTYFVSNAAPEIKKITCGMT